MRLSKSEQSAIKSHIMDVFGEGRIYLFGSRTDDTKRGGDIDLYIDVSNRDNLVAKKVDFLVKLKQDIGRQKIDVVFDRGLDRVIDLVARRDGILL